MRRKRHLSDEPFVVHGVTIRPSVPVSEEYRNYVRAQHASQLRPMLTPRKIDEEYRRWRKQRERAETGDGDEA